jgi:hypothetical protein
LRTLPARRGCGQRPEGAEHVQERGFHTAALKGFEDVEVAHGSSWELSISKCRTDYRFECAMRRSRVCVLN